jgi:hypothetical protein
MAKEAVKAVQTLSGRSVIVLAPSSAAVETLKDSGFRGANTLANFQDKDYLMRDATLSTTRSAAAEYPLPSLSQPKTVGVPRPTTLTNRGAAVAFAGVLALVAIAYFYTRLSRTLLFWSAFILTRPLGATVGDDLLTKPVANCGLNLSIGCILFMSKRAGGHQQGVMVKTRERWPLWLTDCSSERSLMTSKTLTLRPWPRPHREPVRLTMFQH